MLSARLQYPGSLEEALHISLVTRTRADQRPPLPSVSVQLLYDGFQVDVLILTHLYDPDLIGLTATTQGETLGKALTWMLLSQLPSCKRAEIENLEDLKLWEQFSLFALSEAAGFHSLVSSPFSLYLQMSLGLWPAVSQTTMGTVCVLTSRSSSGWEMFFICT